MVFITSEEDLNFVLGMALSGWAHLISLKNGMFGKQLMRNDFERSMDKDG